MVDDSARRAKHPRKAHPPVEAVPVAPRGAPRETDLERRSFVSGTVSTWQETVRRALADTIQSSFPVLQANKCAEQAVLFMMENTVMVKVDPRFLFQVQGAPERREVSLMVGDAQRKKFSREK